MRYCYRLTGMVKSKQKFKLMNGCGTSVILHSSLMKMQYGAATSEDNLAASYQTKYNLTIHSRNYIFRNLLN